MSWDVFSLIYNLVATPLLASVDAMMGAMATYVAPVLRAGLIVFVVMRLLWKMFDGDAEPLSEMTKTLLLGAVALYMVSSAANYGPWARDVLLNGLPREIGQALAGSLGARPITGVVFGEIWGKAFTAGLAAMRRVSWWEGNMITLGGAILLFWFSAIIATTLAFVIWLKAFIFLALLVGVGPLFAGLWVFPLTRQMATGWFSAVMSAIVLQILVVALLALLLSSVSQLLSQLVSAPASAQGNEIVQIKTLLSAMVLFGLAGYVSYFLPSLAAAITGGFVGYGRSSMMRMRQWGGVAMPSFGSSQQAAAASPSYGVSMAPAGQIGGHQPAVASRGAGRLGGPPGRSLSN